MKHFPFKSTDNSYLLKIVPNYPVPMIDGNLKFLSIKRQIIGWTKLKMRPEFSDRIGIGSSSLKKDLQIFNDHSTEP